MRGIEHWFLFAIRGLVVVLLLVPLITVSEVYFPFIVPRNIAFRVIVEAMALLYIALILRDRSKYLPPMKPLSWLLQGMAAVFTLSSLVGGNFLYSFWGNFERMEGLITLYHLIALYFVMIGTHRRLRDFEFILHASIFVAYVLSLVGLSQIVGVNILLASSGGSRVSATLGNPTYLAAYLVAHLFFAAYFLLQRNKELLLVRSFAWMCIVLDVIVFYFQISTSSVGAERGMLQLLLSHWLLALSFLIVQGVSFSYFVFRENRRYTVVIDRVLASLLLLLFGGILLNTQTRGALVGFAVSALFTLFVLIVRKTTAIRVRAASAAAVFMLFVGFGAIFVFKDSSVVREQPILARISSISAGDATAVTRLATWKAGLKGLRDRPVFGWGSENFAQVFNLYFPTIIYTDEGTPLWFDRPHNLLVQYAVEGGIVGLLVFIATVMYVIILLIRRGSDTTGLLIAAFMVSYVVQNVFVFDSINTYILLYLIFALVYSILYKPPIIESTPTVRTTPLSVAAAFMIGAVVLIGWSSWKLNIRPFQANRAFVRHFFAQTSAAQAVYSTEQTRQIFSVFDAAPFLGRQELLGAYSEFVVDRIREKKASESDLRELVDGLAERFDRERAGGYSHDARFNMFQMNLYLNAGAIDSEYYEKVLPLAEVSIPLSPTRPQLYYIRGRTYMNLGRYEEGLADFKKAVELAPKIPDAHSNLFAAYATVGDRDAAREEIVVLRTLIQFDVKAYSRFVSIYVAAGLFDEAQSLLQQALQELPEQAPGLYVGVAEVHALAGNDAEARTAMQEAVRLDPSTATYAEDFYRRLDAGEFRKKRTE